MSMYTTKVLDILRNYALSDTNQTFDKLIDATYQDYFNFDFPWYADDANSKVEFEKLFLLHFLMYEIGQETIELHRSRVAQRLRLIMPEMTAVYDAMNFSGSWSENVNMTYEGVGDELRDGNKKTTSNSSINGTSKDTSQGSTTVDSQSIDSDNPQINFSGTDYASNMSRGETKQNVNNTSNGTTSSTESRNDNEEKTDNVKRTEKRSEKGNNGMSKGDIIKQIKESYYNLNLEIIKRCEDLFMLVY